MPRGYNRRYATKKYVHKAINQDKWSPVYRANIDFQDDTVDGGSGTVYNLTHVLAQQITTQQLWTRQTIGTDDESWYECEFSIAYIRIHLRCATGENEELSAVSQTVRMILYRSMQTLSEHPVGGPPVCADVDGMPKYPELYGEINGLYWDKTHYVHSWATDGNTTAGGQVMFKKLKKPKYTDTFTSDQDSNWETEKSLLLLQIVGDEPTGANSQLYGWVEIGFQYKTE